MDQTLPPLSSFMGSAPTAPAPSTTMPPLNSFIGSPVSMQAPVQNPTPNPDTTGEISGAMGNTFQQGASDIMGNITAMGNTTETGTPGQKIIGAIADVGKTAGNIAGSIASTAGGLIGDVVAPFLPDSVKSKLGDVAGTINSRVSQIPGMTPEIQKSLGDVFNTITLAGGAEAEPAVTDAASNVIGKVTGTSDAAVQATKASDLQAIADTVSPKLSAKEIKLAESQGRIVTGKSPTLLRGGTPDQILTSDKIYNSAQVINREIPGAAKMSQPDLYTALEGRTTDMSTQLKPQMESTPLKPEALTKMNSDWETLKQSQMENADATDEPNVLKSQKQFEQRLNDLSDDNNLNDVWQARKDYDDSVPANVKNANHLSSESLQNKKEIWLQNRAVLNDMINDSSSGLGKTSQQAFKDMSAMYDAKANLLSKAKDNFEASGRPSKVSQWIQDHPWVKTAVKGAVGVGVGSEILKHL